MFPVDTIHPSYYEDRNAQEKDKKSTTQPTQQAKPTSAPSSQFLQRPPVGQRPPLSRPGSWSGSPSVLGNIFNGFVRANSPSGRSDTSTCNSGASTPVLTPSKIITQAEVEAMMAAEKKKDADIQAFRAW